jgi:hypothetical protein
MLRFYQTSQYNNVELLLMPFRASICLLHSNPLVTKSHGEMVSKHHTTIPHERMSMHGSTGQGVCCMSISMHHTASPHESASFGCCMSIVLTIA